jgi:predicted protein tyrosine phosphatase
VAIISITDPESPSPRFIGKYDKMLSLKFWDVTEKHFGWEPMSPEQAEAVVAFLDEVVAAGINDMVVHCEAGISRSAGTASAIWRILGESDAQAYTGRHFPNTLVQRMIARAADRSLSDGTSG